MHPSQETLAPGFRKSFRHAPMALTGQLPILISGAEVFADFVELPREQAVPMAEQIEILAVG